LKEQKKTVNHIWESKIYLKRKNPRASSRFPFIYDDLQCLVILDEDHKMAELKTNELVVSRHIQNQCGKTFSIDDIIKIEPIKNLGRSLARY
jgi:hypothetical protein